MSTPDGTRQDIGDTLTTGLAAAQTVGGALGRKADRSEVWKIATVAALFAAGVAIAVSVPAASSAADARAAAAAAQEAGQASRERAEQAYAAAQLANEELKRRGQPAVDIPPPSADNTPETLVAAATARVLASLPPAEPITKESLGLAVASYFLANPVTVPPELVAERVSAFLRSNPPPAGVDGEDGVDGKDGRDGVDGKDGTAGRDGLDGKTPTGAEIMAAFNQAAQENPSLLCAGKGTFTLVRGVLTIPDPDNPGEQKPRDIWTCEPTPTGTPSGGN